MGYQEDSVGVRIGNKLDQLLRDTDLYETYADSVSDTTLRRFSSALLEINSVLRELPHVVRERNQFDGQLERLAHSYEEILSVRAEFLTNRLADEVDDSQLANLKAKYERLLKETADAATKTAVAATNVLDVAEGVSLEKATGLFKANADEYAKKVTFWGRYIAATVVTFIALVAILGTTTVHQSGAIDIRGIIDLVWRVTILTVNAGFISFGFKMVRINLHLRNLNLHRKTLASTMHAFTESVDAKERSQILKQLVDAIAGYGDDGLVEKGSRDMVYAPQMIIDTLLSGGGKSAP